MRSVLFSVLTALLAPSTLAQPVTWEKLPHVTRLPTDPERVTALDFLYGEGAAADDPAADSLVVFGSYGVFLYNPSGAAGDNGE